MVTGTHTPAWFYCFGSLAAPRLSTPFPAVPGSHHPPDDHPTTTLHPPMGVDHPLIRPSTPFGQTSTHRSRKPAPCSLPTSLCLSRSLPTSLQLLPLHLLLLLLLLSVPRFVPPSLSRPTSLLPPPPTRAGTFNLARIPRMHQLFLIVCLTRTHAIATAGWIQTRITHASIAQVCATVRTCPCPAPRVYIRSFVRGMGEGRNSIDTAGGTARQPTNPFLFPPFSAP